MINSNKWIDIQINLNKEKLLKVINQLYQVYMLKIKMIKKQLKIFYKNYYQDKIKLKEILKKQKLVLQDQVVKV